MRTLTVTAKGQVILCEDLLQHLGISPGERVSVDKLPDGRIEMRAARPGGRISDVFGMLKREGGRLLSVGAVNRIATDGWAGKR